MTKIRPFKAVRPPRDKAYLVASRPYYTYKKKILNAKLKSNKFTFLHVINPEFHKENKTLPNTDERFEKVKERYDEFMALDYFKKDQTDCFYVYRQQSRGNDYIGIIAGASVQEYLDGQIKIHEHTIPYREETFKRYLNICKFNAEPVLLTYPDHEGIDKILNDYLNKRSEYEFTTTDDKTHNLWLIESNEDQNALINHFKDIEATYIADGHHRSASSVLYSESQNKEANKLHEHFLAFFIAESKLRIYDYNRVISNLEGFEETSFLDSLAKSFDVIKIGEAIKPRRKHQITLLLNSGNYLLEIKPELFNNSDPVNSLDTQLLNDLILHPILNITDIKTDNRVHFVAGTKGVKGIKSIMKKMKGQIGFSLFPVSIEELKNVADQKKIMPPKSTWIEPKLRSGLTIYEYND